MAVTSYVSWLSSADVSRMWPGCPIPIAEVVSTKLSLQGWFVPMQSNLVQVTNPFGKVSLKHILPQETLRSTNCHDNSNDDNHNDVDDSTEPDDDVADRLATPLRRIWRAGVRRLAWRGQQSIPGFLCRCSAPVCHTHWNRRWVWMGTFYITGSALD